MTKDIEIIGNKIDNENII